MMQLRFSLQLVYELMQCFLKCCMSAGRLCLYRTCNLRFCEFHACKTPPSNLHSTTEAMDELFCHLQSYTVLVNASDSVLERNNSMLDVNV